MGGCEGAYCGADCGEGGVGGGEDCYVAEGVDCVGIGSYGVYVGFEGEGMGGKGVKDDVLVGCVSGRRANEGMKGWMAEAYRLRRGLQL